MGHRFSCRGKRPGLALLGLYLLAAGASAQQAAPCAGQAQAMQEQLADWPQLKRYQAENAALPPPAEDQQRVVFFGDSITEGWGRTGSATFFPGKPYVNRGIAGQTTAQMVVRLRQDVIALKPAAVVILAGTNDIAGATPNDVILANLRAIMHACQAADIPVVVSSLLPVSDYNAGKERTDKRPPATILALNAELRALCAAEGARYVDLHKLIADEQGLLPARYSADGLHPNAGGYAIFSPVVQAALNEVLSAKH